MGRWLVVLALLVPLGAAAESFEMTVLRGSTLARVSVSPDGSVREETLWEPPRRDEPPPAAPALSTRDARPEDEQPTVVVVPVSILASGAQGVSVFLHRGHATKLRGHPGPPGRDRRPRRFRISTRRP